MSSGIQLYIFRRRFSVSIIRPDSQSGIRDLFINDIKNRLDTLLVNDYIPVIAPIGMDDNFLSYNINADDAACAIATAMGAEKLAFLTDIEGVYRDFEDKSSLISVLTLDGADEL